eukprot:2489883-Rhodomonas_salina.2
MEALHADSGACDHEWRHLQAQTEALQAKTAAAINGGSASTNGSRLLPKTAFLDLGGERLVVALPELPMPALVQPLPYLSTLSAA